VLPKDERKTSAGYLFLRGGGGAYRFYWKNRHKF
jgi:hypothetical protein